MHVPNPSPHGAPHSQPVQNPAGGYPPPSPQPFAQPPYAQAAAGNPAFAQPPYAAQAPTAQPLAERPSNAPATYAQQPYVPPVYDAGPPKPPRPPLSKDAARRARLAGGIGGGITWLGLGLTQLCTILLLLPVLVGAVIFGVGFAIDQDGSSATAGAWSQVLAWLGSPGGIALAIGIPGGIVLALLGLWISTRMLRHPGLRRPVGVTWAGFGIAVGATVLLSGLGSFTLPFFGGLPLGDALDVDPGFGPGVGPGPMDEAEAQQWLAQGGADFLEQLADPGTLLGIFGPWIAVGQLLALLVPIVVSIFTWWWMAHAMRPAGRDSAGHDAAETRSPGASAASAV